MMPSKPPNATAIPETSSRVPARHARKSSARKKKPKAAVAVNKASRRGKQPTTAKHGSKKSKILALLKRPGGASLQQLQKATGWQAHSVRGFLSGALKKTMGLHVDSVLQPDGVRSYILADK